MRISGYWASGSSDSIWVTTVKSPDVLIYKPVSAAEFRQIITVSVLLKSPFSQCYVIIQLPSLSFLLEENALEVPHVFQKSFFFFLQNIFPHLKWIPLHQLLLDQLLILLRFSFFKQAKAVWSTRPTVDIYSISFSRSGLPWWLSSKESAGNAGDTGTWVQSLGGEDLLEEEIATHSSILAWTIQWTEEPGELQPKGSQRIGHDWVFLQLGMTSGTWSHWPP